MRSCVRCMRFLSLRRPMQQRTLIITAIPVAILLIFSGIGVVASRSGDGDGSQSSKSGGFAIAEPVKAKWERAAADATATFAFDVENPRNDRAQVVELTREKILLDNQR